MGDSSIIVKPPASLRADEIFSVEDAAVLGGNDWLIGNPRGRDVQIALLARTSRAHARLTREADGYVLRPERGATFVDAEPLSGPRPLCDGDAIAFGDGAPPWRFRRIGPGGSALLDTTPANAGASYSGRLFRKLAFLDDELPLHEVVAGDDEQRKLLSLVAIRRQGDELFLQVEPGEHRLRLTLVAGESFWEERSIALRAPSEAIVEPDLDDVDEAERLGRAVAGVAWEREPPRLRFRRIVPTALP